MDPAHPDRTQITPNWRNKTWAAEAFFPAAHILGPMSRFRFVVRTGATSLTPLPRTAIAPKYRPWRCPELPFPGHPGVTLPKSNRWVTATGRPDRDWHPKIPTRVQELPDLFRIRPAAREDDGVLRGGSIRPCGSGTKHFFIALAADHDGTPATGGLVGADIYSKAYPARCFRRRAVRVEHRWPARIWRASLRTNTVSCSMIDWR